MKSGIRYNFDTHSPTQSLSEDLSNIYEAVFGRLSLYLLLQQKAFTPNDDKCYPLYAINN